MTEKIFDPKKLDKLNNPERIKIFPVDQVVELAGIRNPKKIVDYGAGTGFFSRFFAQKFPQASIYAADISEVMVKWMNENIVPENTNILTCLTKGNRLNLPDNSVDFLFMVNLHHELDDHQKVLLECKRLLKKGGKIAVSDFKKEEMEMGPPLEIRFDESQIEKHLKDAGFQNIVIKTDIPLNNLLIAEKI